MTAGLSVIVTGGTFGVGREISLGLAEAGHRVLALGVDAPQVSSTADGSVTAFRDEARGLGRAIEVLEADVTDAAAVDAAVARAIELHGRVDALVNCAAIGPLGTVLDTDEERFERVVAVNLKGPYLASRAVIPHMIEHGGGAIVNIGSGAGWGKPNMAAYCASKGGLAALTTATAYDFFHDRIRVNLVIPGGGGIAGGMTFGRLGGDVDAIRRNAVGSVAGRPITGYDMAGAVDFLIGPAGETISGSVIDVGCFANQGGPLQKKGK